MKTKILIIFIIGIINNINNNSYATVINKQSNQKSLNQVSEKKEKEIDCLKDVLIAVYENSAEISNALIETHLAAEEVAKVNAQWLPTVDFVLSPNVYSSTMKEKHYPGQDKKGKKIKYGEYNYQKVISNGFNNSGNSGIIVNQHLFNSGATMINYKVVFFNYQATIYKLNSTIQQTLQKAIEIFLQIIENKQALIAAKENEKYLKALLDYTKAHAIAGQQSFADSEQAKGKLADSVLKINQIETQIASLYCSLEQYMGKKLSDKLVTPKPLNKDVLPNKDKALEIAKKENPEYLSVNCKVQASMYGVDLSVTQYLPRIELSLHSNRSFSCQAQKAFKHDSLSEELPNKSRTYTNSVSASINASIPIYHANTNIEYRVANEKLKHSKIESESVKRQLINVCTHSYIVYEAALDNVASAKISLNANKVAMEMAQAQYQLGEKTFVEALNAEEHWYESYQQSIKVDMALIKACYDILSAVGRLNPNYLRIKVSNTINPKIYFDNMNDSNLFFHNREIKPIPILRK